MQSSATRVPVLRRALLCVVALSLVILVTKVVAGSELRAALRSPTGVLEPPMAELVNVPRRSGGATGDAAFVLEDTLFGRSGHLRARILDRDAAQGVPAFRRLFGDAVLAEPRVLAFATQDDPEAFAFITTRPWSEKRGAYVGRYHVGFWPGERRAVTAAYDNPTGFVEVTPENADIRLSTHFRLRDFLTHDQDRTWPKYVVLREELLDKLELVLADLERSGVPARRVRVLSGFRTPQYNARIVEDGGAARASRHQFGDAADIIIDSNGDGRMDDLNRDGRVNLADTEVLLRSVERVERKYPELVGGLGLYHAMGPSGPFAHIDVRGERARWGGGRSPARASRVAVAATPAAERVSGCRAEGEMAVLCAKR